MKKGLAALSCLFVLVAALLLVGAHGIQAKGKRGDTLEERVSALEVEATINRGHVQTLENHVRDLEANAGDATNQSKESDLEGSVHWIREVYIPSADARIEKLDKDVKTLGYQQFLVTFCAHLTAKQRTDKTLASDCSPFWQTPKHK
jgi:hypothetical protein